MDLDLPNKGADDLDRKLADAESKLSDEQRDFKKKYPLAYEVWLASIVKDEELAKANQGPRIRIDTEVAAEVLERLRRKTNTAIFSDLDKKLNIHKNRLKTFLALGFVNWLIIIAIVGAATAFGFQLSLWIFLGMFALPIAATSLYSLLNYIVIDDIKRELKPKVREELIVFFHSGLNAWEKNLAEFKSDDPNCASNGLMEMELQYRLAERVARRMFYTPFVLDVASAVQVFRFIALAAAGGMLFLGLVVWSIGAELGVLQITLFETQLPPATALDSVPFGWFWISVAAAMSFLPFWRWKFYLDKRKKAYIESLILPKDRIEGHENPMELVADRWDPVPHMTKRIRNLLAYVNDAQKSRLLGPNSGPQEDEEDD